jgi:hypothetical protein
MIEHSLSATPMLAALTLMLGQEERFPVRESTVLAYVALRRDRCFYCRAGARDFRNKTLHLRYE